MSGGNAQEQLRETNRGDIQCLADLLLQPTLHTPSDATPDGRAGKRPAISDFRDQSLDEPQRLG
jgi:hypothetical protein